MKTVNQQGTIHLKGYTRFNVYATKPHRVIVDPEQMFLICEAELTFGDDQSFVLKTKEFMPGTPPLTLYRELTCHGKISNGGQVKYEWPESWWELGATLHDISANMSLHTGYVFSGPGINKNTAIYKGNFDGEQFNADFRVNAYQEKPGTMSPYQEVVDGPIKFCISFELQKI